MESADTLLACLIFTGGGFCIGQQEALAIRVRISDLIISARHYWGSIYLLQPNAQLRTCPNVRGTGRPTIRFRAMRIWSKSSSGPDDLGLLSLKDLHVFEDGKEQNIIRTEKANRFNEVVGDNLGVARGSRSVGATTGDMEHLGHGGGSLRVFQTLLRVLPDRLFASGFDRGQLPHDSDHRASRVEIAVPQGVLLCYSFNRGPVKWDRGRQEARRIPGRGEARTHSPPDAGECIRWSGGQGASRL